MNFLIMKPYELYETLERIDNALSDKVISLCEWTTTANRRR